jgi:hypothetical protein
VPRAGPPEVPRAGPPEVRAAESAPSPSPAEAKRRASRKPGEASGDRGLRDLVGAGSSQVGVSGALRARDVNRPSEEELAQAERDVVVVRRNWKPPA